MFFNVGPKLSIMQCKRHAVINRVALLTVSETKFSYRSKSCFHGSSLKAISFSSVARLWNKRKHLKVSDNHHSSWKEYKTLFKNLSFFYMVEKLFKGSTFYQVFDGETCNTESLMCDMYSASLCTTHNRGDRIFALRTLTQKVLKKMIFGIVFIKIL